MLGRDLRMLPSGLEVNSLRWHLFMWHWIKNRFRRVDSGQVQPQVGPVVQLATESPKDTRMRAKTHSHEWSARKPINNHTETKAWAIHSRVVIATLRVILRAGTLTWHANTRCDEVRKGNICMVALNSPHNCSHLLPAWNDSFSITRHSVQVTYGWCEVYGGVRLSPRGS